MVRVWEFRSALESRSRFGVALLVGFPGGKAARAIFGRKAHSLRAITLWQCLLVGPVWITRRNHDFAALKIIS